MIRISLPRNDISHRGIRATVAQCAVLTLVALMGASCNPVQPPPTPRTCTTTSDGYNSCAQDAFAGFASATSGAWWKAGSALQVPPAILEAIDRGASEGGGDFDLLFIIDRTGSMSDDIFQVQQAVDSIVARIQARGNGSQRVGLFVYGDICADGGAWAQFQNLTNDLNLIRSQVRGLTTIGGGDIPESVYDAVHSAMTNATWSRPNRFAILIGDAGPQEDGDPCYRTTYSQAVAACRVAGVQVNMYPILVRP